MSNVTLFIGGRSYTVACADGEDTHVARLGQVIDSALDTMPSAVTHSETRSLLFAALLLADELHELREAASIPAPVAEVPSPALEAKTLDAIATRLEALATRIEAL